MRIVCAPNAFKESLSAIEAGIAMQAGIARAARQFSFPVQCQIVPMADGGDGSLDTLVDSTPNSWRVAVEVCDALGRPITADYGVLDHGRVAVIEMARASGLWRIAPHERDATRTSTFGTGQLLLHALENLTDLKRVVMCIGGSATNDGGVGFAAALGFQFFDAQDSLITHPVGADLIRVLRVSRARVPARLAHVEISVACDVDNPLLGPTGATAVYGPQKGVNTVSQRELLENGLANVCTICTRDLGVSESVWSSPGAGAAGGLGAGLLVFCQGKLMSGVSLIARQVELNAAIVSADLVITGEGKIDASTSAGKVPTGVAKLAQFHSKPCIVIAGSVAPDARLQESGILAAFSICNGPVTLDYAMKHGAELLARVTEQIVTVWLRARESHLSKL